MRISLYLLFTAYVVSLVAQETPKAYYVVVASFRSSQISYAQEMVAKIKASGSDAGYVLDPGRPFCYVFTSRHTDFKESVAQMKSVRAEGIYPDAWVRILAGGTVGTHEPAAPETKPDKKPSATVFLAIPRVPDAAAEKTAVAEPPADKPRPDSTRSTRDSIPSAVVPQVVPVETAPLHRTLANSQILLSLTNSTTEKVIDGEIEVIDTERARLITKVKGNSYVNLPDPKSKSGQLTLICNVFGYRKTQHEINFNNTEADTLEPHIDLVGDYYLIKFDLVRLHKGDIAVLYNVYFYNDAAIMRSESRFELNALLNMMQENPSYKIILHGHTNGNATGKIIAMGPSKEFFHFDAPDRREGFGSAKQLSKERAEVIKEWLISQGVAEDRILVKAWGGGRMLHDKLSPHARKNVRVEVEIVAE